MTHKIIISAIATGVIFVYLPEIGMSRLEALASVYFIFIVCLTGVFWMEDKWKERRFHDKRKMDRDL